MVRLAIVCLIGLGASLTPVAARADVPDAAAIEARCNQSLNLPAEICACMGAKSVSDLNDGERTFLLAMMQEDTGAADALRPTMPPGEIINAATFLRTSPVDCARELAGQG